MHTITLVCSAHSENGLCNAKELLEILCAIEPEVVFQEVRPLHDWSLEAQALTAYRKLKLCRPVYVDETEVPANAAEIKRLLNYGFEYAAEESEEYRQLRYKTDMRTSQEGFRYLNSVAFSKASARMSAIEDDLIGGKAGHALKWWRQHMHAREIAMMRNIYAHCRWNAFDTGVFLIGAGHKPGITEQIKSFADREPGLIVWKH